MRQAATPIVTAASCPADMSVTRALGRSKGRQALKAAVEDWCYCCWCYEAAELWHQVSFMQYVLRSHENLTVLI